MSFSVSYRARMTRENPSSSSAGIISAQVVVVCVEA
jgi:hypothetical protein